MTTPYEAESEAFFQQSLPGYVVVPWRKTPKNIDASPDWWLASTDVIERFSYLTSTGQSKMLARLTAGFVSTRGHRPTVTFRGSEDGRQKLVTMKMYMNIPPRALRAAL